MGLKMKLDLMNSMMKFCMGKILNFPFRELNKENKNMNKKNKKNIKYAKKNLN